MLFLRVSEISGEPELLVINVPRERIQVEEIQAIFLKPDMMLPESWAG
jgi:hypothetical protein